MSQQLANWPANINIYVPLTPWVKRRLYKHLLFYLMQRLPKLSNRVSCSPYKPKKWHGFLHISSIYFLRLDTVLPFGSRLNTINEVIYHDFLLCPHLQKKFDSSYAFSLNLVPPLSKTPTLVCYQSLFEPQSIKDHKTWEDDVFGPFHIISL